MYRGRSTLKILNTSNNQFFFGFRELFSFHFPLTFASPVPQDLHCTPLPYKCQAITLPHQKQTAWLAPLFLSMTLQFYLKKKKKEFYCFLAPEFP